MSISNACEADRSRWSRLYWIRVSIDTIWLIPVAGKELTMLIFRGFTLIFAFLFLSGFAHGSALTYNSTCSLALNWFGPDPGAALPIYTSGTTAGSDTGCSLTDVTGANTFTVSASDVTASVSGSVLTLFSSDYSLGPDTDNIILAGSGSDYLEGTSDASVQGTFTGTYVLTGSNIADDTVLIVFLQNYSSDCQKLGGGGCITVSVTQNGNSVSPSGYPPFLPSLSSIDFSQPFQLSINFDADASGGCCAQDAGGPLDANVSFFVSDANGDPVSANLVSVPEPGSFALTCAISLLIRRRRRVLFRA
jgi:hypothetical protein